MQLTKEEEAMLHGEMGGGVQKAMEIVVALGKMYGAEKLVPVTSVQVSGVSYKNLGDSGLQFLDEWAKSGAKTRVPTTLNPAGMDLDEWERFGFEKEFAEKQMAVIGAFTKIGISPTCTCTPYLAGNVPRFGDHIAWGESSAVAYANSVLGARTNREGGPSALAAAIVGKTAAYGYHLDENRRAKFAVNVRAKLRGFSDFGALGYWTGIKIKDSVPLFRGINEASNDFLKELGAAMAASGAVALHHVDGITPESRVGDVLSESHETIDFDENDLKQVYSEINSENTEVNLVVFGCPHASLDELIGIGAKIRGKTLKSPLWVTTSKPVKSMAERMGLVKEIEAAGGRVLADMCAVVAPMKGFGYQSIAVNSGKYAWYLRNQGFDVKFGGTDKCIAAAISGKWEE